MRQYRLCPIGQPEGGSGCHHITMQTIMASMGQLFGRGYLSWKRSETEILLPIHTDVHTHTLRHNKIMITGNSEVHVTTKNMCDARREGPKSGDL